MSMKSILAQRAYHIEQNQTTATRKKVAIKGNKAQLQTVKLVCMVLLKSYVFLNV